MSPAMGKHVESGSEAEDWPKWRVFVLCPRRPCFSFLMVMIVLIRVSLQFGVTLTGNLARWVERALAYGVLRNELRFSLLLNLMGGMKTSCWRQRTVIKCSTALGHSLSLTTWSSLSEGGSSLFFSEFFGCLCTLRYVRG